MQSVSQGKQTVAILEFYFRFLFLPNFRHRRVILQWLAKFHHNRTIGGEVTTSYRFIMMAARESEIYFQDRFYWWHLFGKMGSLCKALLLIKTAQTIVSDLANCSRYYAISIMDKKVCQGSRSGIIIIDDLSKVV